MIGSDFQAAIAPRTYLCTECGQRYRAGSLCLVAIRGGKVKKRVCSEDCRQTFDDQFWQQRSETGNANEEVDRCDTD